MLNAKRLADWGWLWLFFSLQFRLDLVLHRKCWFDLPSNPGLGMLHLDPFPFSVYTQFFNYSCVCLTQLMGLSKLLLFIDVSAYDLITNWGQLKRMSFPNFPSEFHVRLIPVIYRCSLKEIAQGACGIWFFTVQLWIFLLAWARGFISCW